MTQKRAVSDARNLQEWIDRFHEVRAVVIGDIILDVFLWGSVNRISPEAPVPVVEIREETRTLGGAANVANNMSTLGASVILYGRIGRDPEGDTVLKLLQSRNINSGWIVRAFSHPTTVKTRIIAHNQQVVRFDRETKAHLDQPNEEFNSLLKNCGSIDVIVVSDYAKGVVTEPLIARLREWAVQRGVPVIVDPKVINAHIYKGVTVLTPNHIEAAQIAGLPYVPEDDSMLVEVGKRIISKLGCEYLLITRGPRGMTLFDKGGFHVHMPTVARKVYDVTGAGDTVVATLAVAIGAGMSVADAAYLANTAAGYVVGEVGTATISPDKLKTSLVRGER